MPDMMKLQVYIADDCWSCEETRRVVADVAVVLPQLEVALVNLSEAGVGQPDAVFATPTYMMNGRILFLGNPTPIELRQKIEAIHQEQIKV